MSSIDSLKRAYQEAVNMKKCKDEEKAIKIVERLYPKLLKAAKKRENYYEVSSQCFWGPWGPSEDVLKIVADLVNKEGQGLVAVFVPERWFYEWKQSACVRISGWAE